MPMLCGNRLGAWVTVIGTPSTVICALLVFPKLALKENCTTPLEALVMVSQEGSLLIGAYTPVRFWDAGSTWIESEPAPEPSACGPGETKARGRLRRRF